MPLRAGSTLRCEDARLPRVNAKKAALLFPRARGKWTAVKTETSFTNLTFRSPDAAWRALASIANQLTGCMRGRDSAEWWDVTCDPGLQLSASRKDGRLQLNEDGSRAEWYCTTFPDGYDFRSAEFRESTACFREGAFGGLDRRADIEEVLGPCREASGTLRCGSFRISLDHEGRPSSLSRDE